MAGDTDKISIRGKEVVFDFNVYSSNEALWIGGMAIFGIPFLILSAGIVVSVYRRKRSQGKYSKGTDTVEATDNSEDLKQPDDVQEQTDDEDRKVSENPDDTGEETEADKEKSE